MQEQEGGTVIICNECGIEMDKDTMEVWHGVLCQDGEGKDVIEKYFDCPNCGKHYTISAITDEMRFKIMERKKLAMRLKMAMQNKSKYMISKYQKQLKDIGEELIDMQQQARRKYIGE